MAADLILVDPDANGAASAPDDAGAPPFLSAGRNTPLDGADDLTELTGERAPLRGAVRVAFVGGERRLDTRRRRGGGARQS